jgi:mannose-6-phosphate isomerase-like protein (cupin superfamily)
MRGRVFRPDFATEPALYTVLDWTREPVFTCKQDARKRVALVSWELCRTKAMRAAIAIYPVGTAAPSYHHEGADTFIYVLSGHGAARVDQQSIAVRQHSLIHIPDRTRHYLQAADNSDMRFLTLQVPGSSRPSGPIRKKPAPGNRPILTSMASEQRRMRGNVGHLRFRLRTYFLNVIKDNLLRRMSPVVALKRPASYVQQCLQLGVERKTTGHMERPDARGLSRRWARGW